MFRSRARSIPDLCAQVGEAVDRLSLRAAEKAMNAIAQQLPTAAEPELTDGLTRLLPTLARVDVGNGGPLAALVAGLVEAGADPRPALDVLVERVAAGLEEAARFPALAEAMGGEITEPTSSAEAQALMRRAATAAAEQGIGEPDLALVMQSWFTINDWIPALLLPLQQKRARLVLPQRERLTEATAAMVDQAEDATWLLGLLLVLDDEQLIVVDRATGVGYQVTISGIGDNFQLHTLLAATLIGDPAAGLVAGERPRPEWIDSATTGHYEPPTTIEGQFNLVDADGTWIWNEGRPRDIPVVADRRVVVLDPPAYQRTWNIGRAYPLMPPEISLDRILPPEEAAAWRDRIKPTA